MSASATPSHATATAGRALAAAAGLRLDGAALVRLERCVRHAAARAGRDEDDWARTLATDAASLQALIDAFTVQESSWFRDPDHFAVLAGRVLPGLAGPVTIWSAGCANGQEPYSLAMVLEEQGVAGRVLATDVSQSALRRTERGWYSAREVQSLSPERRRRFLHAGDGGFVVNDALRRRVTTSHHSVSSGPPSLGGGPCPVVFCRNVLIHLDPRRSLDVLAAISRWLPDGGWLFIGGAESLWQEVDGLRPMRTDGSFCYRKAPAADRSPAAGDRPTNPAASLLAEGIAASEAGDLRAAVMAFGRAALAQPLHPLAHFHLGLALQRSAASGARRAFAAALAATYRCDRAEVERLLEGFSLEGLRSVIQDKLADTADEAPAEP